uniref:Clp1 N-terminal beta-sandwich domain-containing protein n=1 Tax=Romanomermis culicivorax TaxID=13658 RepID=A0A915K3I4_ROMCU
MFVKRGYNARRVKMEVDAEASGSMVQEFKLESDQELRFEVVNNEVVVELLDGTAETFGAELVQHKRYAFSMGSRVALYSWHGCRLELAGKPDGAYVAKQTPMVIYLNTHAALEEMRCQAERDATRGPRIMLVGKLD